MRCTVVAVAAMLMMCGKCPASDWSVIDAFWRPDENPWATQQLWDGWYWSEGWGEKDQFWPKHFKPAGSLHVILRNDSSKAASILLAEVDGEKIEDIITTPDRAGRVVWRSIFPEGVQPGNWVECIVRLRHSPDKDVRLGLTAGDERFDVTVPRKPRLYRIESVSFSPTIDRLYIYVRSLDGADVKPGKVMLDGMPASTLRWAEGPASSGLHLAEAGLKSAWELGSYHLVEVVLPNQLRLAYPVRAWDSCFPIGLFGTIDEQRIKEAIERGFNTYVVARENKLLDDLGINYVVRSGVGEGRMRIPGKQSGTLFYNNTDEPDAYDVRAGQNLPYMDRLGVNAEQIVLPWYRNHVKRDPRTPSMCLTDNTYKPLNWYVYGQTSDVFCTDPYVPLGGEQVELIARSIECARDASAPNPVIATLWCTSMGNRPGAQFRPPTPEEERLMTFYALGSGAKGVFYFADRDTSTGENLISVVHNRPLWDEMGRINSDMAVLAPMLAIGCPANAPAETDKVWHRSLMCGPNRMVVIVVNKGHHIGYNTQQGFAWHFAATNVRVPVRLPVHFKEYRVQEVMNGRLVDAGAADVGGELLLKLGVVNTARVFVVTAF